MNHVYQALWCAKDQTWKAVPETARRAHKGSGQSKKISISNALVGSVLLGVLPSILYASQPPPAPNQLPVGGQVVQGTATISQTATAQAAAMTIEQVSQRAVINWNSFSLGQSASVQFNQPSAQAVTLNRITGADPSQIFGKMTAPGQVFVVNPAGVYFSPTASVDVGGLVASTHSISDEDFMGGRMRFERNGASGAVVNQGALTAALGGYIALLAPEVRNQGVVIAHAGSVAMASGETITLNFDSSQRLTGISTTPSAIASLVDNQQAVMAPDGYIILSAVGLSKLQAGVVRNSGSLEASSLVSKGGKIVLEGDTIGLASSSQINAKGKTGGGTVLIGGDWQGSGDVRQATKVTMEAGATIDASATDKGDGGKVVLWSDIHNADSMTLVNGRIQAEAGSTGGDGGRIETSGYQLNVDDLQVSTRANEGHAGQWLLDPYNITISTANQTAGVTSSSGVYTTNTSNSVLKISTLQNALTSGNVEVSTAGAGADAGNITVTNTAISWSGAYTLKLSAAGAIAGNSNISIGAGGNLIFNQASTVLSNNLYSGIISGDGSFTKEGAGIAALTGANIYTGTTTISAGTLQFGNGGATATALMGTGTVVNNGTLSFNAATNQSFAPNIISGTGALTISGTTAGSGTVTLRSDNTFSGGITVNSGPRVAAGGSSTGVAGALTSGPFGTGTLTLNRNSQIELAGYNIANTIKSNYADSSPTIYVSTGTSELSGQIDLTLASSGIRLSPALDSTLRLTGTLNTSTTDNNNQGYAVKLQQTGAGNVFEGFSSINAGYHISLSATAGTWTLASDPGNTIGLGTKANLTLFGGTFDSAGNDLAQGISSERRQLNLNGGTLKNSANTVSKVWAVDAYLTANSTVSTPNVGGDFDLKNVSYFYNQSTAKTLTKTGVGDLHMKGGYVSTGFADFNFNLLAGNLQYYATGTTGSFSGTHALAAGTKLFLNNAVTFSGTITGDGAVVVKADTFLSGPNTYTGGISVLNNATLTLGRAAVMNGSSITSSPQGTGGITLGDATTSGSLNLGGYASLPHNVIVNGTSTILSGSATADQVILGTISDGINTGKGLTFNPSTSGKAMEVKGNNSYTGTTTVSGSGSLVVSNANALGASTAGTTIGIGTLKLKGDITVNEALTMTAGSTSIFGNLSGDNTLTNTLTHASGSTTVSSDAGSLTLTPTTGNAIDYGSSTAMLFTGAGNIVVNGPIAGSTTVTKSGAGMLTLAGNNTFTGAISLNAGTLRAASNTALGTVAGGVTVANGATLELGGPASPGGITIGAEALTVADGGAIRNVAGFNNYDGAMTLSGNATITVDTGTKLNFRATGTALSIAANKRLTLNLTDGDLTIAKAISGGAGASYLKAGGGTLITGLVTGLTLATGVYVRLYDPTGSDYSSVYGSTPDYTFGFFDAATGGNKINLALTTGYTGSATWTGTAPTASSAAGAYSLTYASGLTVTSASYVLMAGGATTTWTVSPKPITIAMARPDITYNGITSYADLTSGATYTSTAMVGADKLGSFTRAATLVGGGAANGVAQAGSYVITPSNAVMGVGTASNYSFTYTPVTGTVQKAALTMTANNASILLGQADPTFTASYSGFVNGETSAVLTSPTVVRLGTDSAAGTYANVLRPSATSNNYSITPVNGAFNIVPADTLLIKIADSNNTYGSAPSYSVTSAEYLTGANVLRTVNVTPTGGGHFTYTDGVIGGATTGAFDLVSGATAGSDVNNYAISLANFTKVGNNFAIPAPVTQAGNLAVVPLVATVATPGVSKVYDGTTAATAVVNITNKLAGDDVSILSVGQYTDNANVGAAHAFTLFGFTVGGTKASNYAIDPANLPNLTGNDGAITPAALTLSTSNVVKTYNGSLSVAGATTAPALTVTAGTLFTNVSNGDTLDSVSGGTFAFTNANAGTGNKTVTVTGATVADGNAGGNYTITYANNTTSTITPAALTLSTSNVVKTYNGNVSVAGATTAPALTVASGSLFTNASNGNALDSVSGGTFAFTSAAAGTSNKTVTVTGATLTDGNAGGNYTITYANNTTSTINQKALTASMSAANKTYDGTTAASVTGSSTDIINGDSVSFANTSATFNTQNVGTGKTITIAGISLSGADAGNYSLQNNTTTTSADISKKDVVLTSITAADKTYDGTTTDSITSGSITTGVGTETLAISGTGTFSDKNVATGKTVTVADVTALTKTNGTGAWSNYNLTTTGALTTTAAISKANLAITATATDKVYDTTNAAAALLASNMVLGDSLTLSKTSATFSDKNVGIGKTVTVAGLSISGTDAGNYNLTNNSTTTTATISKANLAITATAAGKVYDTTIAATANLTSNMLAGDSLTLSQAGATFSDKNVGIGKTVTLAGLSISGTDAGNYNLTNNSTTTTATISKANLAITATATDKVYDTSTAATASLASDMLLGDSLTLSKTGATFSDKNVGTGKTVTVAGLSISGTDAGNYNLTNTSTNATASISQAALSITATQVTKTYDGGLSATGNATVGALAGVGDSVSNTGSQAFIDKNVGTGKTVTASGVSIKDAANADMTGNYNITYVANNTSVVNRAALSITANADARFATQTDAANFNGVSYSGFVGGDTSAVLGGALAISRTNALTDVAAATYTGVLVPTGLTASNYTIGYTNGNYTIVPADRLLVNTTSQAVTYGTTPTFTTTAKYLDSHDNQIKVLTQTGTNNNYTYNDGAGTTISLALKPYTGATVATLSSSNNTVAGTYDVKDTAYVQNGTNFNGTPVFVGTLTVDQKAITPSATGVSKVYDGTTTMGNVVIGMTGKVANDNVTISGNGAFSQKNVGANLGYAISGITLASADAGNYYLSGGVNSFSGNDGAITVAPLVITSGNVSKVYDRTTAAAGVAQAATGSQTFGSDSLSGGTFVFTSAAAGAGNKTVTVSGVTVNDGNSGNNYAVTYANNNTSTISPAALTISGITASNKVYDASADATVSTAAVFKGGLIAGDVVNVSATGLFADKNVGLAKTVTLTSTYTGADVTNYTITGQASANANITAKAITVTGVAANDKVYDASTAAALNLTVATLTNGAANATDNKYYSADTVTLVNAGASGAFANANVGIAKAVAVSGFTLTGTDAGNYSVTDASSASASISTKALTVSGLSVPNSKTYDGSRSAVVTSAPTLLNAQAAGSGTGADGTPFVGDTIHFVGAASGTYNTKDAVSANTVSFAGLTSDNPNYTLTLGTQAATITPKALTISGITAADRMYDGTSQATVSSAGVTNAVLVNGGLVSGDAVTVTASGVFRNALNTANDANVAANKTVALTSTYSGADVSNYTITGQATTQANLTVHPVTLSASKSYDGSDNLTGYVTIQTGVANENLTYSGARANASDNSANNFIVSIVLNDGTGLARNYVLPSLDSAHAPVTIQGGASNSNTGTSSRSRSDSEYFRAQAPLSRFGNPMQMPLFVDAVMTSTSATASANATGASAAAYSAGVTVDLVNAPSARVSGFVAVQVPRNMSTQGAGLIIPLPAEVKEGVGPNSDFSIRMPDNSPLPSWIRYSSEIHAIVTGAVPEGAFPMQILVFSGGKRTLIQISENQI